MKHVSAGVLLFIVVALVSNALSASASAICARVDEPKTGNKEVGCNGNTGVTKEEYIEVVSLFRSPGYVNGLFCAVPKEGSPGNKSNHKCTVNAAGGRFILVKNVVPPIIVFAETEEGKNDFTATGGESELSAAGGLETIICETNSTVGEISSDTLAGNVVVHFLGCRSSGESKSGCIANSVGSSGGLILTRTLHGVLGLALPSKAAGLLLLPGSGSSFVTIAGNECTPETAVTGNVTAVVEPISIAQSSGKLIFAVTSGKQNISGFDPSTGGSLTAKLVAFSIVATESASDTITYEQEMEVS